MKFGYKILSIISLLVASFEATAINDSTEILQHFAHTKKFLCERGICPDKIPTIYFEEKDGYLGYHNKSRISISPSLDSVDTQLTLVHEFIHAFREQFNPHEKIWLNEGLAKLIEYQYSTLWPLSYMERLKKKPIINLDSHPDGSANYAPNGDGYLSSFFLMQYLYTHFGQEKLLQKLLTSPKSGWDNIVSAIQELIQNSSIAVSSHLVSKESILRHFAVALWMNDMYLAKYALFHLDQKYEALNQRKDLKFPPLTNSTQDSMKIQFHPVFQNTNAQKVYSILSYDPFVIKEAESTDKALIFIYLFY